MPTEYQNTLKLKSSPLRYIKVLLASSVVTVVYAIALKNGILSGWLWLGIVLPGLGIPLSIINMLPNSNYLLLTPEGFTIRSSFKSRFFKWSDVKGFNISQLPIPNIISILRGTGKMVTFEFSDTYTKLVTPRAFVRDITGFNIGADIALESGYGMKLQDLCNLMNEWRERYIGNSHPETIQTTPGISV